MSTETFDLIGVGSPIVDLLAQVEETFIKTIDGDKGGMVLVNDTTMDHIIEQINKNTLSISPGGAAANTTFAASHLGLSTAFLGKLGRDENAHYYEAEFCRAGGSNSRFKHTYHKQTARCLSLVTPDAERTMRTNLGAAQDLEPEDIKDYDFENCRHVHIEGYLLFKQNLLEAALKKIKNAGCTISLDLGSFEVVNAAIDILPDILTHYIDIVFANEEEAEALCRKNDHRQNLDYLADFCSLAVIKLGKDGALIKKGNQFFTITPDTAKECIDTTGAGDLWASGFLYGYLRDMDLEKCGRIASYMGARAVEIMGTSFSSEHWVTILKDITAL